MSKGIRVTLSCLSFLLAFAGTLGLVRGALDNAEIEAEVVTRHAVANYYNDRVETYRDLGDHESDYRVALLGDSMVVSYPLSLQIADMVQRQVRRLSPDGPRVRVLNLGLAGTGVFDYYFMADVIARLDPKLVIIEFNLTSTSDDFHRAFSRPELSGWLEGWRILESAWLPVSWIGLTFDRLLLYSAIIRSGGFESWVAINEEQVRFAQAREQLDDHLAVPDQTGVTPEASFRKRRGLWLLKRNNLPGGERLSRSATRSNLGTSLDGLDDDNPSLVMLGATVRTYRHKGIEVLVYVNPINVEHIGRLELLDESNLAQSIDNISSAVVRHGGHFADLHRIFPDEGFRDRAGHFAYEGKINGPAELAARLAPLVVSLSEASQHDGI